MTQHVLVKFKKEIKKIWYYREYKSSDKSSSYSQTYHNNSNMKTRRHLESIPPLISNLHYTLIHKFMRIE